jgi:hypothetical protein
VADLPDMRGQFDERRRPQSYVCPSLMVVRNARSRAGHTFNSPRRSRSRNAARDGPVVCASSRSRRTAHGSGHGQTNAQRREVVDRRYDSHASYVYLGARVHKHTLLSHPRDVEREPRGRRAGSSRKNARDVAARFAPTGRRSMTGYFHAASHRSHAIVEHTSSRFLCALTRNVPAQTNGCVSLHPHSV